MINTIKQTLENSFSFADYRKKVTSLIAEGKSTGHTQSEDLLKYSELNETRMNRLEKTIEVTPETKTKLQNLDKKYIWLVLSEGWCGDAAQIVPVIHKMAEATDKVELKIALRDDNDALMQHFLTNGGKAIPKLIVLDAQTLEVVLDWGPRPHGAKQLILDYKAAHGVVDEPAKIELQKWYLHDKGISIQNEIVEMHENILA
ncbi:thioredoxin family protein [Flavobacterium sp.]|uniref:thioredoxin family protein n=1 Tax=Flavobacterium sp. TaxID=239 RepID=UPI0008CBBC3F|nr:thioredoxin family protein [Flavobacterium sp.]OGS60930.1 MAG: thioredoxin [Flavobacteria bacterium GWF1_32_7]HBD25643.1 thioredoxin family protein [Flavobacterium sp.]